MLQEIQRTDFEELIAFVKGDISIARDEETGATLYKTDGQYVLIISEEPYQRSHWSRRTVQSDEDAVQRAQKVLVARISEQKHVDQ